MFDSYDFSGKFSLKYSEVPKDYDISDIQFIFDFIYLVFKRDVDIDKAIESVSDDYGLSEDYLKDYLIENKYILNKSSEEEFLKQVEKLNTKSLKKLLKKHGFKASGKRDKIIERVKDSKLFANYQLSSKSRIFYQNKNRRMDIFNGLPQDFYYFNDFNEYYMDNFRKKADKIPVDFINQYVDKAIDSEDHRMFTINNSVLAEHFFLKDDYKSMLEYVLKIFCINLNPIWKLDDLDNHEGISQDNCDILLLLHDKLGKNRIISAYFVVWDSFNFEKIIVSKYAGYKYLKDILNNKDYFRIVEDLDKKYYSNVDLKIKKIVQKTLFDF